MFAKGFEDKYEGDLEHSALSSWVLNNLIHIAKVITDSSQFYELQKLVVPTLVMISKSDADLDLAKMLSTSHLNINVVTFKTDAPPAELNVTSIPHVILVKNYDEPYVHYNGNMIASELFNFAHLNSIPLIAPISQDYKRLAFMTSKSVIIMFTSHIEEQEYTGIYEIALKKRKGMLFAIANPNKPNAEFDNFADILGWSKEMGDTAFLVVDRGRGGYYKMESNGITAEHIEQLIQGYISNKIHKYYKSEPVPSSNDDPVLKIVGKNFNEIIKDQSKNVIILFTSAKCTKCYNYLESLRAAAANMKDRTDLVFGTFNITLNSAEGLTIYDTPELRGYSKLKGKLFQLVGYRELNDITDFAVKLLKTSELKSDL